MSRGDDLAVAIRLACLTESRSDAEQRALLRTARAADDGLNQAMFRRLRAGLALGRHQVYPSTLEALVATTRVLDPEGGDHPVVLSSRRPPWVYEFVSPSPSART